MATAITIQDIIDAIDSEPEMLEALRARLLTRELLELPERFAEFQTSTLKFQEETLKFREETLKFREETLKFQEETRRNHAENLKFQEETRRNHAENLKFQDEARREFVNLGTQVARLNGWMASRTALEEVPFIVDDMGYELIRTLERLDLIRMVRNSDTSGIARNDLDSFRRADAVAEAVDNKGDTLYVAIEISYTAQKRDAARAIRNAEFLTRFTGVPASAAVAGIQMSDEIRGEVAAGDVFWHQLPLSVLQPE